MEPSTRDLIGHLSGFVTEQRFALFKQILDKRTRHMTVLLEDIYQSQNASAVLRTCECLGIQDVHIVEQRNEYDINPDVALGSNQWLSMHYYNHSQDNIEDAVNTLRKNGYRIVATSPHTEGNTPEDFDLEKGKAALMFGTELNGLTAEALSMADEYIQIPMVGFTESYNISVSAAVILYTLRIKLEQSGLNWRLPEMEKQELLLQWLRKSIKMAKKIEDQYRNSYRSTF
jgi:tRNA (guanosine-2'-O-)-methyltransferase